jgi:hypothetical protein
MHVEIGAGSVEIHIVRITLYLRIGKLVEFA